MAQGYFFDIDGTLVTSWTTDLLPGVKERIAELKQQGAKIAFVTNQAGPAWFRFTYDEKYPEAEAVAANLATICNELQPDLLCVAINDERIPWSIRTNKYTEYMYIVQDMYEIFKRQMPDIPVEVSDYEEWRKPEPGMIQHSIRTFNLKPSDVLFVGDMDSDKQAADRAGVEYQDAKLFFGV